MPLSPQQKLVEGSMNAGIVWDGWQYMVLINGDYVGTFGSDITYARKVLAEKKGMAPGKVTA